MKFLFIFLFSLNCFAGNFMGKKQLEDCTTKENSISPIGYGNIDLCEMVQKEKCYELPEKYDCLNHRVIAGKVEYVPSLKKISEQVKSINVLKEDALLELKKCDPSLITDSFQKNLCLYFTEIKQDKIIDECLSKYRNALELTNIAYETSDTCDILKGKLK